MSAPAKLLHVARAVFTPLSIVVIAVVIWQSRVTLGRIFRQGEYTVLLAALLLWMLSHLLAPLVSTFQLKACDMAIPYRTVLRIHCSRLPAKYLPGGIWHSVGRANDYLAFGFTGGRVGALFLIENLLLVAVTLGMSAALVWPIVEHAVLQQTVRALSPLMLVVVLILPLVARLWKKNGVELRLPAYIVSVLLLTLYWTLMGLTFVVYLSAFDGLQVLGSAPQLASIYIFSWCLGYLALFAPQGIGVSEYISGTLLTDGNAMGAVLAFLVGFRALALVGDLLCWLSIRLFLPKQ